MNTYRKYAHGMMALTLLMSISPQSMALVRMGGGTAVAPLAIQQSPGEYTIRQIDESKINIEVIRVLEQRSKEDAEYVKESIRLISTTVNTIVKEQVKEGLLKLSDESLTSGKIPQVSEFLGKRRALSADIEVLNSQIIGLSKLPSVMKGNASISVGDRIQQIQNRFNIDMGSLVEAYEGQVQDIVNRLSALEFKLVAGNGKIIAQRGLDLSDEMKRNQFTAEEVNKLRNEGLALKAKDLTKNQNQLDIFNNFTLKEVTAAITEYGRAYRNNLDEDGMKTALKKIETTFFMRSVLRATYGIPLGALHMNYELKGGHLDFFSSDNQLKFTGNVVRNSWEFTPLHNAIATALVTQEGRKDEVFGYNKSIFGRVTSAVTWLKGERALARMNYLMLKMLLADLDEETVLGPPGGRFQLKSMLESRYFTTENAQYYQDVLANIAGKNQGIYADVDTAETSTLRGVYNTIEITLKNYRANLKQGQGLIDSADQMEKEMNGGRDNAEDVLEDLMKRK